MSPRPPSPFHSRLASPSHPRLLAPRHLLPLLLPHPFPPPLRPVPQLVLPRPRPIDGARLLLLRARRHRRCQHPHDRQQNQCLSHTPITAPPAPPFHAGHPYP